MTESNLKAPSNREKGGHEERAQENRMEAADGFWVILMVIAIIAMVLFMSSHFGDGGFLN